MIQIENTIKRYNNTKVVDISNLTIGAGETVGLVGNNGAGKTTLFRLILDLIAADSGQIVINGMAVAGNDDWKKYVGAFVDESFLIDFLHVKEYFDFIGTLYGLNAADIRKFLEDMQPFFAGEILESDKLIREYSLGNKKKIGIAAAIMGQPNVLILDEPFTSLDPTSQIRLKKILNDLNEHTGMTTLISSHDLNHITDVSKRIIVMHKGVLVKDIMTNKHTLAELEAYFGE
ncbi:ABC transporter ATP-binding protein [Porphyromonas pogonae]|uniref:ABC transporter ATP-binding protein n=1 Tax=Porphyromonas pogonae TaxID=867595 RepID=UPI002E77D72E|nr:ABC transporter ATP-binding protein [Porphyromonas pogonae]